MSFSSDRQLLQKPAEKMSYAHQKLRVHNPFASKIQLNLDKWDSQGG